MRKVITMLIIIAMILPTMALAENYTPKLGMTIEEYIIQYNAIQAPLGAPYVSLEKPYLWTTWNDSKVAWFRSDSKGTVTILMVTADPSGNRALTSGLDMIQIYSEKDDIIALLGVANRCSSIFAANILGNSFAPQYISSAMIYFYENNCKDKGILSYYTLDTDQKYAVSFFYSDGYYFQISAMEDVK